MDMHTVTRELSVSLCVFVPLHWNCNGIITDGERFAVLSDILGDEDHLGDMDFKSNWNFSRITACQNIKIDGLKLRLWKLH
jgi:polyribonucleotide nucleotidyltransferase